MDFLDTVEFFHRDLAWAMSSNVHLPECGTLVYPLVRARAGP